MSENLSPDSRIVVCFECGELAFRLSCYVDKEGHIYCPKCVEAEDEI